MLLKLIGSSMIMISAVIISYNINRNAKKQLSVVEALITLIRFFKLRIDCYCEPINDILLRTDTELLFECGYKDPPLSTEELLSKIDIPANERIMDILRSFVSELGNSYREEQLKSCDYHLSLMNDLRASLASALPKKKKLTSTVTLSAAAGIIILLI